MESSGNKWWTVAQSGERMWRPTLRERVPDVIRRV